MLDRQSLTARLVLTGLVALLFVVLAGINPATADDDDDDGGYYRHHYGQGHHGHRHWRDRHWRKHHQRKRQHRVVEHHHYHYDSPPPYRSEHRYPAPRYGAAGAYGHCNGAVAGGIFGGGAGAAIGAAAGEGDPAAIVGGVLAGILVGSVLGQSIDAQDSYCIGQTLEHAPDGSTITWDNPRQRTSYEVTPKASYRRDDGRYCREFISSATVAGRVQQVYGTACWQPDGSWQIVQANY